MDLCFKGRIRDLIIAALSSTVLSGCAFTFVPPDAPASSMTEAGPTYGDALTYLHDARTVINKQLGQTDDLQALTKLGVGAGLAGAGAAAAFQATSKPILGFLTLSAVSYSANATSDAPTAAQLLNAGLNNLDCIESAGDKANTAFGGQKDILSLKRQQLSNSLSKLSADISAAQNDPDASTEVKNGRNSFAAGTQTLGDLDQYLAKSAVGGEMIRAIRRTLYAVNEQLRERAPSISAVAQSGSILSVFLNTGSAIQASASAGAAKIQAGVAGHSADRNLDNLVEDQDEVKSELAEIASLLTPISVTAITQCQAQFAAEAPLALLNSVPIDLNAGATVVLRTISGASVVPRWSGVVPTDVTWNVETDGLAMTAQPSAKTNTYKLQLADFSGHASNEIQLNVHAAVPADQKGAVAPPGPGAGPPAPPSPGH